MIKKKDNRQKHNIQGKKLQQTEKIKKWQNHKKKQKSPRKKQLKKNQK